MLHNFVFALKINKSCWPSLINNFCYETRFRFLFLLVFLCWTVITLGFYSEMGVSLQVSFLLICQVCIPCLASTSKNIYKLQSFNLTCFILYPHGVSLVGMCVLNNVFQISHLKAKKIILIAHYLAISLVNVKKLKHLEARFSSLRISIHF